MPHFMAIHNLLDCSNLAKIGILYSSKWEMVLQFLKFVYVMLMINVCAFSNF